MDVRSVRGSFYWMDGMKVASDSNGMTVGATRQCAKNTHEW